MSHWHVGPTHGTHMSVRHGSHELVLGDTFSSTTHKQISSSHFHTKEAMLGSPIYSFILLLVIILRTVAWALPSSPSHHLLLPLLFHVLRAKVRQRSDNEKGRYKKKRHAKVWLIREGQISFWANNEFRPKFSKIVRNGWNEPKWGEIEFEVELRVFPFRFACWYEKFRPFWSEWNEIQNID